MNRADDFILDLLDTAGIAANPVTIAYNIGYDNSYVASQLKTLEQAGLVNRVSDEQAMYEISDRGRDYLAGNVDRDDLERALDED